MEKVDSLVWFHNFKKGISDLIYEHMVAGYKISAVVMTPACYKRCTEALGYEPDNILGYKIQVRQFSLEEEAESMVGIAGDPIQ